MIFSIAGIIMIIICLRTGYWRQWKEYYATILYVIMGNLVCDLMTCQKQLWCMGSCVDKYFLLEFLLIVTLYPSTVILYMTGFPKTLMRQIIHILLWSALFIVLELASWKWCGFRYYNGWTVYHSLGLDIAMFTLIRLHYKKPFLAWLFSGLGALGMIWWFKLPFEG